MHQSISDTSRFALLFLQFQCIDQFNGGEETHPVTVMLNGLNADGAGEVGLDGTRELCSKLVYGVIEEGGVPC